MARHARHDVDYFPFMAKEGQTQFILESKFGLEGDGFLINLLRFLAQQPDHYFCLASPTNEEYFFARLHCPDLVKGMAMLKILVMTGKINKELWEESRVVVSEDFLNSIKDAYKDRKNKIVSFAEIQDKFRVSRAVNPVSPSGNIPVCKLFPKNEEDNSQTKVKNSKRKKTISLEAINMANLLLGLVFILSIIQGYGFFTRPITARGSTYRTSTPLSNSYAMLGQPM